MILLCCVISVSLRFCHYFIKEQNHSSLNHNYVRIQILSEGIFSRKKDLHQICFFKNISLSDFSLSICKKFTFLRLVGLVVNTTIFGYYFFLVRWKSFLCKHRLTQFSMQCAKTVNSYTRFFPLQKWQFCTFQWSLSHQKYRFFFYTNYSAQHTSKQTPKKHFFKRTI